MPSAVLGGGNFGTVIANILAANDEPTSLYLRDAEQVEDMKRHRENRRYLPGHKIHENVNPTSDLSTLKAAEVVFVTVPSTSFREAARDLRANVRDNAYLVSGTKGMEVASFSLMSQILTEEVPQCSNGVLSGPNLAQEIAENRFAGTVIASLDRDLVTHVQEKLRNRAFRTYASSDVFGVELGGALKNIYAIICGMAMALDVGQNALAMVITRSLAEMSRFANDMGANPFTFLGLAGVGDLLATCTSPLSRNYQLGFRIAQGATLEEANEQLGKLAEGVNTLRAVYKRKAERDIYMPLVDALHQVLYEQADMRDVMANLMGAAHNVDVEFAPPR